MNIKPIYSDESNKIQRQLSEFICSHNMLSDILEVFEQNETAKNYFEEAKDEVLESGNQSLSSMYAIALENLIKDAEYYQEDKNEASEVDKYKSKIRELERENRILKTKIENIEKVLKGEKS